MAGPQPARRGAASALFKPSTATPQHSHTQAPFSNPGSVTDCEVCAAWERLEFDREHARQIATDAAA